MGAWSRGFEAQEKGFKLLWSDRKLQLVIGAAVVISAVFLYMLRQQLSNNTVLFISSLSLRSFYFLMGTAMVYFIALHFRKKITVSLPQIISLVLWLLICLAQDFIAYTTGMVSRALIHWLYTIADLIWYGLTFYITQAIVLHPGWIWQSAVQSIKTFKNAFVETIALIIWFNILSGILVVPFGLLYGVYPHFMLKLIPALLGVFMALAFVISKTLLYLYAQHELPANYLERKINQ